MKGKQNELMVGSLCAMACEILYGLSYMFTKQATELASPFALLGWRFLVAILVMTLIAKFWNIKGDFKSRSLKPLILIALFSPCIYFIAETIGISETSSSESGIFLACIPVASLLASTIVLKNKPNKFQTAGILVTFFGVMLTVFAVGQTTTFSWLGYFFLVLAVVSYALYSVCVEKASSYTDFEITYAMLLSGFILFTTLALIEAVLKGDVKTLVLLPTQEINFLIAILYQGIGCSVLAFFLSNIAISKIGVNKTSSFIGLATVTSIIVGATVLHENMTFYQIVGAIVILCGVYIANILDHGDGESKQKI
ncbi:MULTISPECIES: DMT family transporter [Aerococcus]|uniref:DMT family transporter n=1 Tax=Aerococcus sanguinicola TaxID=119206 RepID=A0A5N1GID5_9LACT|nr:MULTISPECIES: DMT family transporter [Aerococcus]KAA9300532.1 DMT family transporter [Aerococcus sanguinicola]MDK6370164.1 DMT family transporter [Aerococcus sp. UMB9870]MDK6680288.1 DMT family transporter [Aerococcus sp. UMB8608]MDK6686868.1 DMT family transporter [Aerococcus sp. UMB8623]MDK6939979.1 DMT family transporter [Aerococcus sp. UMB8487]